MKTLLLLTGILLSLTLVPFAVAEEGQGTEAPAGFVAPVVIGNKICPVSGEKVGEMGDVVTHEYEGRIYNFCCKMCLKDFEKDPKKYIEKVNEEMKASAPQQK